MSDLPLFPDTEYDERLARLRHKMAELSLDVCLVSAPANIFYLSGLNHQGYFAYHMLIVPLEGEMILIARAMEKPTIEAQVNNARFVGYADNMNPAQVTCDALIEAGYQAAHIGIEKDSPLLTVEIAEGIMETLPDARWSDARGLVGNLRLVKSERELAYTRQAVAVADNMMRAAIDAARAGINERQVAAEVYHAMAIAGGDYPSFSPFIRSTPTLAQEHVTWSDRVLLPGDVLFVELSGGVNRYHAPIGRLIFIEKVPPETRKIEQVCLDAFDRVVETMKPGVAAQAVYRAWQEVVDQAGLAHYRRHHCGYLIGIGFPPSWTGGSQVVGLREGNDMILEAGMVFHTMSWLMNTGQGDYFVSETAIVTDYGCELLSTVPRHLHVV